MLSKRKIFFIIKIFLAITVFIWIYIKVKAHTTEHPMQKPEPVFIIIAILLLIPNIIIQIIRWHFLLKLVHPMIHIKESITSLFGGWTIGLFTPARLGEFSRALFLANTHRVKVLGMVFIDKLYLSMVNILFGIWGIILFFGYKMDYSLYLIVPLCIIGILLTVIVIHLMIKPNSIRTFFYNLSLLFPFRDKMKSFIEGLDLFNKQKAKPFIILSLIVYIIYITQFCFLALAFESISFHALIISTTSTMFVKLLLPFSIGDLGIRELAAIVFFKNFSDTYVSMAFNSAFLLFLINIVVPAMIGLFYISRMRWRENDHMNHS